MTIVNFTPHDALYGGLLIGLAATLFFLFLGRVFGISGILGGLFRPQKNDTLWRIVIISGLILGALTTHLLINTTETIVTVSGGKLIAGGLLMGFGTRLGSGCTSGHGVCGISRLSPRSIYATLVFMIAGISTVTFFV